MCLRMFALSSFWNSCSFFFLIRFVSLSLWYNPLLLLFFRSILFFMTKGERRNQTDGWDTNFVSPISFSFFLSLVSSSSSSSVASRVVLCVLVVFQCGECWLLVISTFISSSSVYTDTYRIRRERKLMRRWGSSHDRILIQPRIPDSCDVLVFFCM